MKTTIIERRSHTRYELRMPLRYRVSQKGEPPYIGTGLTQDLSIYGIGFRCRKSLPVGAHVELMVDWPAKYGDLYPVELHATGFVMRSNNGRTAIRMTSHRLRVSDQPAESIRVSA
jgi:PilZ domain